MYLNKKHFPIVFYGIISSVGIIFGFLFSRINVETTIKLTRFARFKVFFICIFYRMQTHLEEFTKPSDAVNSFF